MDKGESGGASGKPDPAEHERITKQFAIALEAIGSIAEGEKPAQAIAQQALDNITRVGMAAIALKRLDGDDE